MTIRNTRKQATNRLSGRMLRLEELEPKTLMAADLAGNTLATAQYVGTLGPSVSLADVVSPADPADVFKFHLNAASRVNVQLQNLSADADVRVKDGAGRVIAGSYHGGITSETIDRVFETGDWYVEVYPYGGATTGYHLTLGANAISRPSSLALYTPRAISSSQIELTWSNVDNEDGYRAYQWNGRWQEVGQTSRDVTRLIVGGLAAGSTNYFYVSAYNQVGDAVSNVATGTTLVARPDAPTLNSATGVSANQVELNWSDVGTEDGYRIYQWKDGRWQQVATTGRNVTRAVVGGLAAGSTNYFYVSAFNQAGEGISNLKIGTTLIARPDAPILNPAIAVSATQVALNWSDVGTEDGYRIYQWKGQWQEVGSTGRNATRYTVNGLTPNTEYFFYVSAYNQAGASLSSYRYVKTPNSNVETAFVYPLDGGTPYVTQRFGGSNTEANGITHAGHLGVDLRAKTPLSVFSIGKGTVTYAQYAGQEWGNVIIIEHHVLGWDKPLYSMYAHLSGVYVQKGQSVDRHQNIGLTGDGNGRYVPHLHFELRTGIDAGTNPGLGYSGNGFTSTSVDFDLKRYIEPMGFIANNLASII